MGREGEVVLDIDSVESANDIFVKVFDDEIAEKWKAEALSTEGRDVTQKMSDWVIDELRYKAKIFKETGTVSLLSNPPLPPHILPLYRPWDIQFSCLVQCVETCRPSQFPVHEILTLFCPGNHLQWRCGKI
jgi:hypothetical protein